MAGHPQDFAPWEQRKPAPPVGSQPTQGNPYAQPPAPTGFTSSNPQPYQGPGYGQNPLYGQQYGQGYGQPYNPAAYTAPFGGQPMGWVKPHRGTMLIILTVCSFAVCVFCGVIGFFMAKNDLAEIKAGIMDPAGEQMTKVAYWVCLIHVCFVGFMVVLYLGIFAVMLATKP